MVKAVLTGSKNLNSKNFFDSPKDGFIHKKKNQKFKQTPAGKVALINGSKAHNNSNSKQQKQSSTSPQNFLQKNKDQKKKDNSKNDKKQQESSKKELNKMNLTLVEEDDTDSEIDEDINEGVVLQDQSLVDESDNSEDQEESDDDDESEEEKNIPNILGNSLADESDEDDDDYEEEEGEEEENGQIKNGVKMFRGLKQANSSNDSLKGISDNSILEESISEDVDEESEDEEDDDDDDDDDNLEEEDDEDELDSSEVEEEEEEDEDDEDEESESEDEEEADESALGLKALIDNTIVDDDEDDEDFVEPGDNDEDDDISDEEEEEEEEGNSTLENSLKSKNAEEKEDASLEQMKTDKRTVFVGNLPKDVQKAQLKKLFKKFGTIDTIRLRGIISKSLNIPKKVAVMTKDVHPKLKSVYAYIKFASEDCAKAALSMNGTLFEGNYLRVDIADKSENKYDAKKSVFLGNLPFNVDDNTVRKHFEQCGELESVRVIRDNKTGVGKGFGYVNFKTEDAVTLALELDGTTILNREVRVKPNVEQHNKKGKHGKRAHSAESGKSVAHKRSKNNAEAPVPVHNKRNAVKRITGKKQTSPQQGNAFQGQKADADKKKRKNKLEKKKKILAEKLTAKPKKPTN